MEFKVNKAKKFVLNVGIIEARNLNIVNENTIVKVSVSRFSKEIKAKTKRTDNPYFNELFRFEFFEEQEKFLQNKLRISVLRSKCRKLIGLCDIELATIWEQPNYQYYHKWAVLTHPKDTWSGLNGYLKCDIQIIPEGYTPLPPIEENGQEIKNNLLVPVKGHLRRQNAIFSVHIYSADSLIGRKEKCVNIVEVSCQNLYVKVKFSGQSAKTKIVNKSDTPSWNQALHFVEAIPSLFQTMTIELWDKKEKICVGSTKLLLKDVTIGNNLPTFGPSFIYLHKRDMIKSLHTNYAGRISISLHCKLLDSVNPSKILKVTNISPLSPNLMLESEKFSLFVGFFQCIFLKKRYYKKCLFSVKHGAKVSKLIPNDNENNYFELRNETIVLDNCKRIDQYYSWTNCGVLPFSMLTMAWPSTFEREYNNNLIESKMSEIINQIEALNLMIEAGKVENSRKQGWTILAEMKSACAELLALPPINNETMLDEIRSENLKKVIKKVVENIVVAERNEISSADLGQFLKIQVELVLSQVYTYPNTFPSIEIAVIKKKGTKISQAFLKTGDVLFSNDQRKAGSKSGTLQTIIFRNSLGEEVIVLDAFVWFGKQSDLPCCTKSLHINTNYNDLELKEIAITEVYFFELRAHIYHGRFNPGSDSSGLADPFVRVIALDQIRESQVKAQTLNPLWDETLVFSTIKVHGCRWFIKAQSTYIIIEVLDYDGPECTEVIGRAVLRPTVTLLGETYIAPRLKRQLIYNHGEAAGEILMTVELIEKSEVEEQPLNSVSQSKLFSIPEDIRPHFCNYQMESILWGIRNFDKLSLFSKVIVLIKCNGVEQKSSLTKGERNFNFKFEIQKSELCIPIEMEYASSLSIAMYEFGCFNRPDYKCGKTMPNVSKFVVKPSHHINLVTLNELISNFAETPVLELDENPDWWSKYYASKQKTRSTRILKIYQNELENQLEFNNFEDFLLSIHLISGKTDVRSSHANLERVATLKLALGLYSAPYLPNNEHYFGSLPNSEPMPFTVHLYVIAAHDLTATDLNGRSDPYISIALGNTRVSDRRNYVYKDVNPIFGKCFVLKGKFPCDSILKVSVMDHDVCLSDDLIGCTLIDLEYRFYTKHRAMCGLSDTFEITGYCKWRDLQNPSEILKQMCKFYNLPSPSYSDETIHIANSIVPLHGMSKETVSLLILRNFNHVFESGLQIVPEHVETRSLYHPDNPAIDQGKLEMWIDIFPGHSGVPTPVNISPRKPQNYQLRVIVWSVTDVTLSDVSWLSGEKCSDIYVKAWLNSPTESQKTDVHYKSITGEGSFNWRFLFPFVYSSVDQKMIVYRNAPFSLELWQEKIPCTLELQVWDNDIITDDFIGSLNLNLWDMPCGTKFSKMCNMKQFENAPRLSLFKAKKIRGWWPIRAKNESTEFISAGKVDLEIELVTDKEAEGHPVGFGREGPQPLAEPKRPSTSFVWSMNPMAFVKILAFRGLGRKLIYVAVAAGFIAFLIAGWLAIPGIILSKLF